MKFLRRIVDVEPEEPPVLRAKRLSPPNRENEWSVRLSAAGHEFNMTVTGEDEYDAGVNFRRWLDDGDDPTGELGDVNDDWRTIDVRFQGQELVFTFRASWVAGFTVARKER